MLCAALHCHVFAGTEGAFYEDVVKVVVGSFGGCGEAAVWCGGIGRGVLACWIWTIIVLHYNHMSYA